MATGAKQRDGRDGWCRIGQKECRFVSMDPITYAITPLKEGTLEPERDKYGDPVVLEKRIIGPEVEMCNCASIKLDVLERDGIGCVQTTTKHFDHLTPEQRKALVEQERKSRELLEGHKGRRRRRSRRRRRGKGVKKEKAAKKAKPEKPAKPVKPEKTKQTTLTEPTGKPQPAKPGKQVKGKPGRKSAQNKPRRKSNRKPVRKPGKKAVKAKPEEPQKPSGKKGVARAKKPELKAQPEAPAKRRPGRPPGIHTKHKRKRTSKKAKGVTKTQGKPKTKRSGGNGK